jgi:hypothetical protein
VRFSKSTRLVSIRKPTAAEAKRGADVVFEREDAEGRTATILACRCQESWEQWGANTEVLADNVSAVEHWRHNSLDAFDEEES